MYDQDEFDLLDTSENTIEDDFEDLDDSNDNIARVEYQVWLLGHDDNLVWTGWDYLIGGEGYDDLTEAQKCFDFFKKEPLNSIKNKDKNFAIPENVRKVWLCIEEVFFNADGEEEETNIVDSITLDYPQEV